MADFSGRGAQGIGAKASRVLYWLRQSCQEGWLLYRNCLEANLLVRAWQLRRTSQSQAVSNVDTVDWQRAISYEKASSPDSGLSLAIAATTALALTCYWSLIQFGLIAQGHVIATGAGHSMEALPDGSEVSLSAHSILTVDEVGPQRVAFLEAGEIIFKIKATPTRPFILQTIRATATIAANATLRVAIGGEIEFEVLEGTVRLALRGSKAGAPVRWLRKGDFIRVPVHGMKPLLADHRGSARERRWGRGQNRAPAFYAYTGTTC